MCHYHHLTLSEREMIMYFLAQGCSISQIALKINRNKSTVSRVLGRNAGNGVYKPYAAQQKYVTRRKPCRPHKKLDNPKLFSFVKDKFLNQQWSPEEIAGRLTYEIHKALISTNTIYREIYAGRFDDFPVPCICRGVIRKLRHRGKSRHTKGYIENRGKMPISHDISERPAGAQNRSRRGHWEGDTVAGKEGRACLVTLVDRKSRFLLGGKAIAKNASAVNNVIISALTGHPVKSITPDRGKEFARHAEITSALGVKFYFPKPHHPWERETNENTNGLLREYFPKNHDMSDIPEEYVQEILIN